MRRLCHRARLLLLPAGNAYKISYKTESYSGVCKLAGIDSLETTPVTSCPAQEEITVSECAKDIEGAHVSCVIEIPDGIADKLEKKL